MTQFIVNSEACRITEHGQDLLERGMNTFNRNLLVRPCCGGGSVGRH